ncbi:diacylglycerol kinase family protein [Bacillus sp. Bva_UNVM-123]|uniref:diacylglycerol kinase family protein n=1 Tax=Bacillus sp. Bva_UNVM-123 TaxID=2829798 RepID=UPI00391FA68B
MRSDSNDKRSRLRKSFGYAFAGIKAAIMAERNLRIHLIISVLVMIIGLWLGLSKVEWLFVLFAIGGMLALEMLNSAIERIVDLVTAEYHPLAKNAKDMAAGAVLIYAIICVIIGIIIFLPKLLLISFN